MSEVLEQDALKSIPPHSVSAIQAEEIARDLALMDELEVFVRSLPPRTEGRSPTTQEIREMAYEDREANYQ